MDVNWPGTVGLHQSYQPRWRKVTKKSLCTAHVKVRDRAWNLFRNNSNRTTIISKYTIITYQCLYVRRTARHSLYGDDTGFKAPNVVLKLGIQANHPRRVPHSAQVTLQHFRVKTWPQIKQLQCFLLVHISTNQGQLVLICRTLQPINLLWLFEAEKLQKIHASQSTQKTGFRSWT